MPLFLVRGGVARFGVSASRVHIRSWWVSTHSLAASSVVNGFVGSSTLGLVFLAVAVFPVAAPMRKRMMLPTVSRSLLRSHP